MDIQKEELVSEPGGAGEILWTTEILLSHIQKCLMYHVVLKIKIREDMVSLEDVNL